MKIAVSCENGTIVPRFGRSASFCFYETDQSAKTVLSREEARAEGYAHESLALWLRLNGADALVCGAVTPPVRAALLSAGLALYSGVTGGADKAVQAVLEGQLLCSCGPGCSCPRP